MSISHGMELLLLIVIQLIYVPLLTLRTITMVKNLRVLTAFFGFMEALVYVFGLTIVFSGEQSILEMMVYALGFALGLFGGVYVEQKLAIGYSSFHVNISGHNPELVQELRTNGFGVTVFDAVGKESNRVRFDILTHRKHEKTLTDLILAYEPAAFIVSFEPKTFRGGYMTQLMKKRVKANKRNRPIKLEVHVSKLHKGIVEIRREFMQLKIAWKKAK